MKAELAKNQDLLDDAKHERDFLGKQAGMHINASEFAQIDHDIEKFEARVKEINDLIAQKEN